MAASDELPRPPGLVLRPRGALRTGIAASLAEGAAVGVVFNALEQWLVPVLQIRLGASASTIFLLTLIPLVINVLVGPWVGNLINWAGGHRAVSIRIGLFQAACLALLAIPAWFPALPGALPAALVLAIAIPASMAVSQPAWFAWTGTFVPAPLQGRYFGRRNRMLMSVKLGSAVIFAGLISFWPISASPGGLACILLAAAIARMVAVRMLLRQPALPARPSLSADSQSQVAVTVGFRAFLAGLRGSHFGRWTMVWSALFFGFMVAGPAFSPYMLAPVEAGGLGLADRPLLFTALVVSCQVMRLIAYPALGWIIDRIGPTLVLRWALLGITIVPASWAFIHDVPTLIGIEVINGLCWCAAECAAMVITLGCHRDAAERIRLIGYHQTLLGLVQIGAVGLGMTLLTLLPPLDGSVFRCLFLASVVLRIPAAILAWTMLPRLPVDVRRQLRGLWRELPGVGLVATASRGVGTMMRRILPADDATARDG
jgi:hypothetical protein